MLARPPWGALRAGSGCATRHIPNPQTAWWLFPSVPHVRAQETEAHRSRATCLVARMLSRVLVPAALALHLPAPPASTIGSAGGGAVGTSTATPPRHLAGPKMAAEHWSHSSLLTCPPAALGRAPEPSHTRLPATTPCLRASLLHGPSLALLQPPRPPVCPRLSPAPGPLVILPSAWSPPPSYLRALLPLSLRSQYRL